MESLDLINEIGRMSKNLSSAVKALQKAGVNKATAENKYRIELSKQILIYRDKSMPVTIIGDVVRGLHDIAMLRLERDIADINYQVALEYINSTKLQLRLLENQISREWGQAKRD